MIHVAHTLPLSETPFANDLVKDYLSANPQIASFCQAFPSMESLEQFSQERPKLNDETRTVLIKSLERQYASKSLPPALKANLQLLELSDTFTITTGHQLNILTGPLYTIFKIASIIALSEKLKQEKSIACVPVFWLASEDHDLEEIDHTQVDGLSLKWQAKKGPAVGQIPANGFGEIMKDLEEKIGRFPHAEKLITIFTKAYHQASLGPATFDIYHELFSEFGLIVLDPQQTELKQTFIPAMRRELLEPVVEQHVLESTKELEQLGYHGQVFPRPINLFYLTENSRSRIIKIGSGFGTRDELQSWSEEEILAELDSNPNRFSPNAIMRPMFQEVILPNLAYIGGGGELSYWLQLKSAFRAMDIPFPILIHRDSAMLMDGGTSKRWNKHEVDPTAFFERKDVYLKNTVTASSAIDFSTINEELDIAFQNLAKQGEEIDPSLKGMVLGEREKQKKALSNLEGRFIKAEKRNQEQKLNQLDKLHESLLPNEKLQERVENFSAFYARHGQQLLADIIAVSDPLKGEFRVLQIEG